ncbi:MAG: excinuclease ABC subunit UvrA [Thermonemataceae bacterium]
MNIEKLDPRQFIIIKGASANNLKGIDVAIPRNQLVIITGVSGSGKSSLAFDTLFAEGQRMYVESLSSYARQFLGRMEKPEVEYIKGVSPAIAIEQKVNTRNPRSTVGTSTEIYDYLKLLFARVGKTISPISGKEVTKDTVSTVVDYIHSFGEGQKFIITTPLKNPNARSLTSELKVLLQKGFTRIVEAGEMRFIEDYLAQQNKKQLEATQWENISILIDRNTVQKENEDNIFRISDSVQTAFFEGIGECIVEILDVEKRSFSDRFELDGMVFEEPTVNFFSFNNPYGACKRCEGFGSILGIDEDLVVANKSLSVYEGAVMPWRSEKMQVWKKNFIKKAIHYDFPIHRAYEDLDEEHRDLLWQGNKEVRGIDDFFKYVESKSHKIQYRVLLSRYRGKTRCPECKGTRLRKDAGYVKIQGHSIQDIVLMSIQEAHQFFDQLTLEAYQAKVAKRLVVEIQNRLQFMLQVGLGYLTLNRLTATLSGGEFQRIKLATSLGSALVGSMYILDEPSIGLHPRDTAKLIEVLETLRDLGNTVIVVEHEEEVMRAANQIIDIGPDACSGGGHLIFQGTLQKLKKADLKKSHTLRFLNGTDQIAIPTIRRKWSNAIEIKGARENNLKNIDVTFPLSVLTVITGVSGSGKSTLIKNILYPALGKVYDSYSGEITGKYSSIGGDTNLLSSVEFVDQNPIGKSSRSNPVTYIKVYDLIRDLFASQPLAKARGYKPGHFSFNVGDGRCDVCEGEGVIKIEMQFMADVYLKCEACGGKRFKEAILEVTYKDKDISDVLAMTVEDSIQFFAEEKKIVDRLSTLYDVGLGYITLGQSSNTLSGGEAQRVKLASFLDKGNNRKTNTLFIFDEPTTGLHFHDIKKLLKAINALIEQGNTVIIIEHNLEVIKTADWIIDLGPEGGKNGGHLNFTGIPEDLIKEKDNYTAQYLREKFS